MADNNHDPLVVGGLQKIFCPVCGLEVKKDDSYHLSFFPKSERIHYPDCYSRSMLDEKW